MKWGMQVRYAGSPWQHELVVEAYDPQEAYNIVKSQYNGITILGYAYRVD